MLWRERRYRFLLNLIDHMPRDSYFVEAMAQDDELAEMNRDKVESKPGKPTTPVSEFGITQEILAALVDEVAKLNSNFIAVNSKKHHKPKPPSPWPRPETARDRAKRKWQADDVMSIVKAATPHAVGRVSQALGKPPEDE